MYNTLMKNFIIVFLLLVITAMLLRYNYIRKVWKLDYGECQWSEQHYMESYNQCLESK